MAHIFAQHCDVCKSEYKKAALSLKSGLPRTKDSAGAFPKAIVEIEEQ
jgi:hypothetical protein